MKTSRLAQRKLNKQNLAIGDKTKKTKKRNLLKPILILIFILAVLLFLFFLFSPKIWDGKSKFAVASQVEGGDVTIEILDPINSALTRISIPKGTQVQAANELGTWKMGSITQLGIDKNKGSDFLKNTIIKSFNFPVIASSNLSLFDEIRIKLFLLTIGSSSESNLNLKDTNYLTRSQLVDGSLGWEIADSMPVNVESYFNESFVKNKNVIVNNSSGVVGEGKMAGKVIEVLGLNFASIQNLPKESFDCKVISTDNDLNLKIKNIFGCDTVSAKPDNNFDIEIDLGVKFAMRF